MARYAFDLDGTLDASPELAHLARALGRDGHKTIVLTASDYSKKELKAKVYALNLEWVWKIVKVKHSDEETNFDIGRKKGKIANKNKVSLYFDADEQVMSGFADTSKIPRARLMPSAHKVNNDSADSTDRAASFDEEIDERDYDEYDGAYLSCPCDASEFHITRCYHCTDILQNATQRSAHAMRHHSVVD